MALVRQAFVNQSGNTTASRTFSTQATPAGTPTAGNLLISCLVTTALQASITPPASPWADIQSMPLSSTYLYAHWVWKISDGTEDTITWSWPSSCTATMGILEFDDAVTTLDDSAEDESNIGTIVTSCGTGTATATESSGLALAFFGIDSGRNMDSGASYSDSFVKVIESFAGAADRGGVFLAAKTFSGTGSHSCTLTSSDTGDRCYGSIALFVTPSGGGGGLIIPTAMHQYARRRS